jgi:hypothetical protein
MQSLSLSACVLRDILDMHVSTEVRQCMGKCVLSLSACVLRDILEMHVSTEVS